MIQSHIFLTQTFVEVDSLQQLLAYNFFSKKPLLELPDDQVNLQSQWNHYQSTGKILQAQFSDKSEFSQKIFDYYQSYPWPTILFLGDLQEYSQLLQEGMLRLLEEPPENLFIFLTAKQSSQILPTIISRCQLHLVPNSWIMKHLDKSLSQKVIKKLPGAKDTVKNMIQKKVIPITKPSDLEREEIDFWLWQINCYLQEYYRHNPQKHLAEAIHKVLVAQQLNHQNLQKKFSLAWLQPEF